MAFSLDKDQKDLLSYMLLVGGFWALLFVQLGFEWLHNPQYQYGLAVPCMGAYLVYLRYLDRPPPIPEPGLKRPLRAWAILLALGLYPCVVVFETNADWRLLIWLQAVLILGFTLRALWVAGGPPWVKHFSWPFMFFLCAVPWPSVVEGALVQYLLKGVSAAALEGLHLLGVPAIQSGNIIQVSKGLVSMEDACSGVRSFQSSIMLGYCLGELFRLRLGLRVCLLALGPLSAVGFNVLRTVLMALVVDAKGSAYANAYHGLAGQVVFMACLGHLWLWALLFKRLQGEVRARHSSSACPRALSLPLGFAAAVCGLTLFSWVFAKLWYGLLPPRLPYAEMGWQMRWERLGQGIKLETVPPSVKERLLYEDGELVRGQGPEGYTWLAYYFSWKRLKAAQLGGFHGPELCLPALGWGTAEEGELLRWEQGGTQLVFRSFRFNRAAQSIYVFFTQWDQSAYPYHQKAGRFRKDRLLEAWHRHRSPRKTSLEVVLSGPKSFPEARQALQTMLKQALVITPDSP